MKHTPEIIKLKVIISPIVIKRNSMFSLAFLGCLVSLILEFILYICLCKLHLKYNRDFL